MNLQKNLFRFSEKVCKQLHKLIINLKCFVKIMKISRDFHGDYSKIIINLRKLELAELAELARVGRVGRESASSWPSPRRRRARTTPRAALAVDRWAWEAARVAFRRRRRAVDGEGGRRSPRGPERAPRAAGGPGGRTGRRCLLGTWPSTHACGY